MMDHNESIYNIIPPKPVEMEKPPMHRSKHSGTVPPSASTFHQHHTTNPRSSNLAGDSDDKVVKDRSHHTLGKLPGSYAKNPENFTKTGTRAEKVKTFAEVKREAPEMLKPTQLKPKVRPAVPKKGEEPVMNLVTTKNFVVSNAVETILAAPKKVTEGAKDYLHKEDYGKTPKYLQRIKKDIDAEYDYIRALQQQQDDEMGSLVRPLQEEERQHLINGLKSKWEQVNTDYQATTHVTKLDTVGKVKRKEKWEAELSQIEKDIEKLNRQNIAVDGTQ